MVLDLHSVGPLAVRAQDPVVTCKRVEVLEGSSNTVFDDVSLLHSVDSHGLPVVAVGHGLYVHGAVECKALLQVLEEGPEQRTLAVVLF